MATITSRLQRFRSESGAELIEFAFVLPILLLVVAGIIDFGFLFREYEVITNAAREGARLSSLGDSYQAADVQARVTSYVTSAGLDTDPAYSFPTPGVFPVTDIDVGSATASGNRVVVWYFHHFLILGPIARLFGGSFDSVTLTASSTMRSEIVASGPPPGP
jgi:Flp pilus assembly protein TadG